MSETPTPLTPAERADLTAERQQAMERAEAAEIAALNAVTRRETAERERDALAQQVEALRQELPSCDGCGHPAVDHEGHPLATVDKGACEQFESTSDRLTAEVQRERGDEHRRIERQLRAELDSTRWSRNHFKAERDALAQQVDDLETHLDCVAHGLHHYSGCTNHFAGPKPGVECCRCRAEQAESALRTAQQDAARLREALGCVIAKYEVYRQQPIRSFNPANETQLQKQEEVENIMLDIVLKDLRAALTAPADPTVKETTHD